MSDTAKLRRPLSPAQPESWPEEQSHSGCPSDQTAALEDRHRMPLVLAVLHSVKLATVFQIIYPQ